MWNKFLVVFLALLMLLSLPVMAADEVDAGDELLIMPAPETEKEQERVREPYEPEVKLKLSMDEDEHPAFINGYTDGTFKPESHITRAESAMMVYGLLEKTYPERVEFDDVAEDSWYYDAIGLLAAGGIIDVASYEVHPDELMTRAGFVSMLSRFFPDRNYDCEYPDVPEDSPYYDEIAKATELGWVNGYPDGTFGAERNITRTEATVLINRALERSGDEEYIDTVIIIPAFSDIFAEHWAYYDIMEATVDHECDYSDEDAELWENVQTEGLHRFSGFYSLGADLYYIDPATGMVVTDTEVNGFKFGPDGKYTSGDAEIDGYVTEVLESIVKPGMTQEEKLRAAYLYTRDGFTYLRRNYYEIGHTGWTLEDARIMFQTKRGNCYCYTSVFYYLTRQLGYDSTAYAGVVGSNRSPHGWVEIEFDGVTQIFDTELEMAYRKKGVYYYDFYMMSYNEVPWPYVR